VSPRLLGTRRQSDRNNKTDKENRSVQGLCKRVFAPFPVSEYLSIPNYLLELECLDILVCD